MCGDIFFSVAAFPHPGGTTPLHLAASANNIACVTMLIWHGADYNAVDEYGRTSLYIAAQKSLEECVHAHLDNAIWKDILSLPAKDTGKPQQNSYWCQLSFLIVLLLLS